MFRPGPNCNTRGASDFGGGHRPQGTEGVHEPNRPGGQDPDPGSESGVVGRNSPILDGLHAFPAASARATFAPRLGQIETR